MRPNSKSCAIGACIASHSLKSLPSDLNQR